MEKYLVIGNPVEHSVSPLIHNTAFQWYGVKEGYEKLNIDADQLNDFVQNFVQNGGLGFNITVPYKQMIMPFLDGVSQEAREIGAVNTVAVRHGMTFGSNTDANGFIKQLESDGISVKNSRVKIIGAGGAARGIVYGLIQNGARTITIYNRTLHNAMGIAKSFGGGIEALPLSEFKADFCDILINTTSVGLSPNIDETPVESLDGLLPHTAVVDIIYSPEKTRFLLMAVARGNRVYNGLKMLIYQGLLANDIWVGNNSASNKALFEAIYNELRKKLNQKGN